MTLAEAVSRLLRDVHQDLAYADGMAYNFDPGDPRAVDVLLKFLAQELDADVHYIDPPEGSSQSDRNVYQGYNEGVNYASHVLDGSERCSLE